VPYLAIGFIGSILLFAINELWVPDSADRAEREAPQPMECTATSVATTVAATMR
jgi:hypothetical protein